MSLSIDFNRRIYRFLIVIHSIKPTIWRSIEIDASATFWELHMAIQDGMGWDNAHLHEFVWSDPHGKRDLLIGIPIDDGFIEAHEQPGVGWLHDLDSVFTDIGEKALYRYDFGDGWECDVILEGMFLSPKKTKYPRCIDGARSAPPEDCGGVGGYYDLLEVLSDPSHEEHKALQHWLKKTRPRKGPYEPDGFDPSKVKFRNAQKILDEVLDDLDALP